jgi:hypothetical protein
MGGFPDFQDFGDEELRELIRRARAEWESRVSAAFWYQRGYHADPSAVAAAILRRRALGAL